MDLSGKVALVSGASRGKAFLPQMLERGEGRIVNISSADATSKAALNRFTVVAWPESSAAAASPSTPWR